MVYNLIKKIGLICLGLASLFLVGCFHIPDEDWLPSRNKVESIEKDDQVGQALNSFIDGIDMVSSQRSEMQDNKLDKPVPDGLSGDVVETEEEIISDEVTYLETSDIIE